MTDPRRDPPGRAPRKLASVLLGGVFILGVLFVGFLVYYAVIAPERINNPTEISDPEVPEEGVAVPDGGELTNVPTQAAPDSPARTETPQQ